MSHLEKDILKGKFGKNPQLNKEAREELAEQKVEKRTGRRVKMREMAGKMSPGIKSLRRNKEKRGELVNPFTSFQAFAQGMRKRGSSHKGRINPEDIPF